MLKINDWTVEYPDGTKAVKNININIGQGEKIALIGANGAGKSTLILSLVGILEGKGEVSVDGIPLTRDKKRLNEIRSKAGIVFQNPDDQLFLPTVFDNIAFGPRNQGLDEETVRFRVMDRLELLHIEHLKDRLVTKLSGGEKRLVAMATVLAMKPEIMILDEPTAFLDPKARRNLIKILETLPHTMLIATHDLSFADEICERSIVMKKGEVFAEGLSKELLYDSKLMDDADVEAIGSVLS